MLCEVRAKRPLALPLRLCTCEACWSPSCSVPRWLSIFTRTSNFQEKTAAIFTNQPTNRCSFTNHVFFSLNQQRVQSKYGCNILCFLCLCSCMCKFNKQFEQAKSKSQQLFNFQLSRHESNETWLKSCSCNREKQREGATTLDMVPTNWL